jgi:hypothetical protein
VFRVDGASAAVRIGTIGNEGDLSIRDTNNNEVLQFDAQAAVLRVGNSRNEGDVIVRDAANREVIHADGGNAALYVGATGNEGDVIVRDGEGREVFHVDGSHAALYIGATGNEGDIIVRDARGNEVFRFDAEFAVLRVGAAGNEGDIICRDDAGNESIHLNGGSGDIILRNADAAEDFDVADGVDTTPGSVMVVGDDGRVRPCTEGYDRAVVGVVAGGAPHRPGIVLDRQPDASNRVALSMMGKVACRADASYGPIRAGDLLTTAPTPGHAMRASDEGRARGAVIGKALSGLAAGQGSVSVLVGLQ